MATKMPGCYRCRRPAALTIACGRCGQWTCIQCGDGICFGCRVIGGPTSLAATVVAFSPAASVRSVGTPAPAGVPTLLRRRRPVRERSQAIFRYRA